jgi:hypothetical protein
VTLPILTQPDPKISGEGALDPLGVATISDRLAEQVLPGLRARMSRPRFLTAMAVCAAVCEGIEDRVAKDGTTPAYVVFEWLVVEGFARAATREDTRYTPGILKAQAAKDSGEPMRASAYLRIPTVFGYHGIYKPLARHAGIVDEDMRLGDHGYSLLKEWQLQQGLAGFLQAATGAGPGTAVRDLLRSAVEDALTRGCTDRSSQWRGWSIIAQRFAPAQIGTREAAFIHRLLLDEKAGTRGEVCQLLERAQLSDKMPEAEVITKVLLPKASPDLRRRLRAIADFESACTLLESALDWIRYLSSHAGARAINSKDFAETQSVQKIAAELPQTLRAAEGSIADLEDALAMQRDMAELARSFDHIGSPEMLFEAVLARHHEVQQAKAPDGKRDWFERGVDGATFVRIPYRLVALPTPQANWNRPYRIDTVRSFLDDLKVAVYEPA